MRYLYSLVAERFRRPPAAGEVLAWLDTLGFNPSVHDRSGGDPAFDLEIPANRGDLLSHLGIAREIAPLAGRPCILPAAAVTEAVTDAAEITVEDAEDCPLYTCRIVRGVRAAPSPPWLCTVMERLGFRSSLDIVDLSNLAMVVTGQPLHVFDLSRLAGGIVVRRSRPGEALRTIDGKARALPAGALLITDREKPVALAGVMGGAETEVRETTGDVLIESASFHPGVVRRSSKAVGLLTEASLRFEKGVERERVRLGLDFLTRVILDATGGVSGPRAAAGEEADPRTSISFSPRRASALLGAPVRAAEARRLFRRRGLRPGKAAAGCFPVLIPPHRRDLREEVDLVEEIARYRTYAVVPAVIPTAAVTPTPSDPAFERIERCKDLLATLGATETVGLGLISDETAALLGVPAVAVENPLSRAFAFLRPSLVVSLLESARYNMARQTPRLRIFEVGAAYVPGPAGPSGDLRLGLLAVHAGGFPGMRGLIDEFCGRAGLPCSWSPGVHPLADPARCAVLARGTETIGHCFAPRGDLLSRFDLPAEATWCSELRLASFLKAAFAVRRFTEPPERPAVKRDFSWIFPADVRWDEVEAAVRGLPQPIEDIEVFDLYRGDPVPPDRVGVSFTVTYREPGRTLTAEAVDEYAAQLVARLTDGFGARLRGGG